MVPNVLSTGLFSGLAPCIMSVGLLVFAFSCLADRLFSAGNGPALPEGKHRQGITHSKDDCSEIPPSAPGFHPTLTPPACSEPGSSV